MEEAAPDPRLQMIWHTVRAIPAGRVATYGQVAKVAGLPGLARFVGYALRQLDEHSRLPWHRVINSQGRISLPQDSPGYQEQRARLLSEGIAFDADRISLRRFQWRPDQD